LTKWIKYTFFVAAASCWLTACNPLINEKTEKISNRPVKTLFQVGKIESRDQVNSITNNNISPKNEFHYTASKVEKIGELLHEDLNSIASRKKSNIENDVAFSGRLQVFNPQNPVKTHWIFRIIFDNDIFANTDYYYTNGTGFQLVTPLAKGSPLSHILPGMKDAQIDLNGFSITQNMYTPVNPDVTEIQYGDHPFAAYLTLGQFREVYDLEKKLSFKSKITFGVIGQDALGKEVQGTIHNIHPVGWVNQINNDLILNYNFMVSKAVVSSSLYELNVTGTANIGTLYDNVSGGLDMRIGRFIPVYRGPVSIFGLNTPGNKWQYWFSVKGGIKAVAYDATLQGGMFSNGNPYVIATGDINRLVYYGSAGIAVYYRNVGLVYDQIFIAPEFKNARNFAWGSIKIEIAF